MPGGALFPLVLDAAVIASINDGIGGLLVANVGLSVVFPTQVLGTAYTASGIGVTHPGAAFSGLTVRAAAIGYEPGQGVFGVSQARIS